MLEVFRWGLRVAQFYEELCYSMSSFVDWESVIARCSLSLLRRVLLLNMVFFLLERPMLLKASVVAQGECCCLASSIIAWVSIVAHCGPLLLSKFLCCFCYLGQGLLLDKFLCCLGEHCCSACFFAAWSNCCCLGELCQLLLIKLVSKVCCLLAFVYDCLFLWILVETWGAL